MTPAREPIDSVVVRFAGDSGDGMQVVGGELAREAARAGDDLQTLPDFPAEIRAPAGTPAGVSAFQVHFGAGPVLTAGDRADVLVAMNPAALRQSLPDLERRGMILANAAAFTPAALAKAGYSADPLEDGSLDGYEVHAVDISRLCRAALAGTSLSPREIERTKNFFALGVLTWLYDRALDAEEAAIRARYAGRGELAAANAAVLRAGYAYGENGELFQRGFTVRPARLAPGTYRQLSGNGATALGLVAAARQAGLELFLGSYPITPASDVLHELARLKEHGVIAFQAEDEIAAVTAAVGAAFAGALAATTTSGPGLALKSEGVGLAVMAELPLLVIDVQRAGPSTGLPTKTEQADLLQAVFGRSGESPLPVLAAATPGDCFDAVLAAAAAAVRYMTPVILLSDGYLGSSAEPFRVPTAAELPALPRPFAARPASPAARDPATLARPWIRPGTPGLGHRVGGLEKDAATGHLSQEPGNHARMVRLRAEKLARLAVELPPPLLEGSDEGDLLVVGWGSTQGAILQAVRELAAAGRRVSAAHLRWLHPLGPHLGPLLRRFRRVLAVEGNLGQLALLLRAHTLVDVRAFGSVHARPLRVAEVREAILTELAEVTR